MQYYIGMMSGTSLDGIDAVLSQCDREISRVHCHIELSLPHQLKQTLHQLNYPNHTYAGGELHQAKTAEHQLTICYADAYHQLIKHSGVNPQAIRAIGAHGQTIRHEPNAKTPYTIQLLNGALLSQLTQQTVICDFRSKDLAAGGQGAPLAPLFHRQLFAGEPPFAVINIGGISNVSLIQQNTTSGYDCGPGNCLLDEWATRHLGKAFDKDGQWAAQGNVLPQLLARLLADNYFSSPAPKSTGRDYFHLDWFLEHLSGDEKPVDVMRTLTRLTAAAIANEIPKTISSVIVAGGGAKNPLLVADIQTLLPQTRISLADDWGVNSQQVESLGFALLAHYTLKQQAVDTRQITGAKTPVILGAVYSYHHGTN